MSALGRLTKRVEYLRVAGARHKWATPGLVLQARPRGKAAAAERTGAEGAAADHASDHASDGGPRTGAARAGRRAAEPDPEAVRYGITVSRKVGNAVQRNRARRRLRALARSLLPQLGARGTDYVLIGRAGTLTRSWPDLHDDLTTAVRRLQRRAGGHAGSGPAPGGESRQGKTRRGKRRGSRGQRGGAADNTERTAR
jgi:ribonuclease P protein component